MFLCYAMLCYAVMWCDDVKSHKIFITYQHHTYMIIMLWCDVIWCDYHHVSTPPYIHDNHAVIWCDVIWFSSRINTIHTLHDIICCDVMWCDFHHVSTNSIYTCTYPCPMMWYNIKHHCCVRVSPCKVSVYCCVFVWCWMRIARKLLTLRDHVIFFLSTTTTSAG